MKRHTYIKKKKLSSAILCVDCCIIQTKLERSWHANVRCAPPAVTYRGDLNSNVNAEQAQQNTAEFVQHRTHPSSCPLLVTESEDSYPAGNSNITFEQSPHAAQVGHWVQNCLSAEAEPEEVRTTQTLGVIQYVRAAVHWTTCLICINMPGPARANCDWLKDIGQAMRDYSRLKRTICCHWLKIKHCCWWKSISANHGQGNVLKVLFRLSGYSGLVTEDHWKCLGFI